MALLPNNIDYTDKDFDALRVRLFKLIRSAFPEWTDQSVINFGNILVELFAHVGDVVTFYQDAQALESRLTLATQRKNLLGLCKLIGFTPSGPGAATVDVTLSIDAPVAGDVPFPAGTVVSTADVTTPVRFQLLALATIPAGSTSVTASVENSEDAQDTFSSTGLASQEYALGATPYLDGSAAVVAADGAYVERTNFLSSTATDKHFTIVVDQNDRARVRFGNGVNGAIPTGNIVVQYKTGGGANGNVEAAAVKRIDGSFTDTHGNPVQVSVTNAVKAAGGRARMTNNAIKQRAPASVRAPVNSIAREDFVINAMRLPAVARALMLTSNQDLTVPENTGHLYVIPTGGGYPSAALKAAVKVQVTETYPSPLTFVVETLDPVYRQVDIGATIYRSQGFTGAAVKAAVQSALATYFAVLNTDGTINDKIDFGGNIVNAAGAVDPTLAWSDIENVVRDTLGVRKVDAGPLGFLLNGLRSDVTLAPAEFPTLGVLTLIDGDTGLVI